MTLENLLNASKLSPEEISTNLKYKNLKNEIVDVQTSMKRDFFSTIQNLVESIANDNLYNCMCYMRNSERRTISEEDKKILLLAVYEKAKKHLCKYQKRMAMLTNIKDEKHEEEPVKEIEVQSVVPQVEVHKPVRDMFGY